MIKLSFGRRNFAVPKIQVGIVLGALWLGSLLGAAFLVYLGLHAYDTARTRLSDQATSYTHLIAEHDRFGFTTADVVLRDISEHFTGDDFNKPMPPDRRAQVLQLLRSHRDRLPGIASFSLINAQGIRIIGVSGSDGTNLSDRGYFKANRDGQDFFISNVEDGRASGMPGIHVTRRFSNSNGTFGGIVELNLAAEDVFFSYYRTLNLAANYGTSLRDPQRILISYPGSVLSKGRIQGEDAVGIRIAQGQNSGIVVGVDPSDGIKKLTAFERLQGTNFYATASLPTAQAMGDARVVALGALLSALACLVGALGATSAINKAQALANARTDAERGDRERQALIRQLQSAVEEERRSISHEIHDVINAIVLHVRNDAQGILTLAGRDNSDAVLAEIARRGLSITKNTNDLYEQGRSLVKRLRPEILDVLGLEHAIDEMIGAYRVAHPKCSFSYQAVGDTSNLNADVSIAAYRVVQEALSNVVKHAQASQVSVSLYLAQGKLEITIEDDGRGYDASEPTSGVGLVGMRERVSSYGGKLVIRSGLNGGTRIEAIIPVVRRP